MDIKAIGKSVTQIDLNKNEQSADSAKSAGTKLSEIFAAEANNKSMSSVEPPIQTKVVYVVDKDKNIFIQIIDKDGKVVKQIPPEEYRNMAKKLKEVVENFYDKWV